jgi:hypothetical protein
MVPSRFLVLKGQVNGPALTGFFLVASFSCLSLAASLEVVLDGEILFRLDLSEDPRWCILWNHSVAGFEVRDCYRYDGGTMLLESSHAPDFAAGPKHNLARVGRPGHGRITP